MKAVLSGNRIVGLVSAGDGVAIDDDLARTLMDKPHLLKQFLYDPVSEKFRRIQKLTGSTGVAWWERVERIPESWIAHIIVRHSSFELRVNDSYMDTPELMIWIVEPDNPHKVVHSIPFVRDSYPLDIRELALCSISLGTPSLLYTIRGS